MSALAVVPARGGSKGIPRKNLALLAGTPLLVHTLRTASASTRLDRVVVSTDDPEIAGVARAEGVEVVDRPTELARDDSPTEDALVHILETLRDRGEQLPEYVVTLEPTSPLRRPATIDACLELAEREGAGAVMTVAESRECWGRLDGSRFAYLFPAHPRRRQLREPLYREAGTVYVTRTKRLLEARSVLAEPLHAIVVDAREAIDVNTEFDLRIAEALFRAGPEPSSAPGD
jgi:CMP-N-acetylneuraminic acid synthetase